MEAVALTVSSAYAGESFVGYYREGFVERTAPQAPIRRRQANCAAEMPASWRAVATRRAELSWDARTGGHTLVWGRVNEQGALKCVSEGDGEAVLPRLGECIDFNGHCCCVDTCIQMCCVSSRRYQ